MPIITHAAGPEHEMAALEEHNAGTALLNTEKKNALASPPTSRSLKLRDFLRHTRLQILGAMSTWRQEPRKVAMYRSRRVATFHSLLHLIPLGGAIVLLVLRWMQYWIGEASPDATTLQFVAKLHELLMQVSIAEIILSLIRAEATQGFVPLGALSGAVQATQLSYLWSLDFVSIFTSNAFHGRVWHKVGLAVAIPFLMVSTALVGPSGAVLMIPEPGCPKTFESTILASKEHNVKPIFPSRIGRADGLDMQMESLNLTLTRFAMGSHRGQMEITYPDGENYYNNDRLMQISTSQPREIARARQAENPSSTNYATQHTVTIPMRFAGEVLMQEYYSTPEQDPMQEYSATPEQSSHNATGLFVFPHPVASATCIFSPYTGSLSPEDSLSYPQKDGKSIGVLRNMTSIVDGLGNQSTSSEKGLFFAPLWLPSPEHDSQASVVVLIRAETTDLHPPSWLLTNANATTIISITTCSLSVYWNVAPASMRNNEYNQLSPIRLPPLSELKEQDTKNITLDITGIDMLTDVAFTELTMGSTSLYISSVAALAISNMDLAPQSGKRGLDDAKENSFIAYTRIWYSYGYCSDSTSVRLSMAVIVFYCTVTTAYLVYIVLTGTTSTAWNSAIELVALALQSKKPDYPGRIGVGIDSLDTFNQGVGIRVNKDDELELVFASDRDIDSRGLRKLERNIVY